jgi:transcriptional regulator with XRE-family HTH domain
VISSARTSFIAAFAEELHRAREYNGVTLDEVAAVTHVSGEFLDALEAGRWEAIPQPYLRGYLQLYAQAADMNVDKVLQNFDQIINTSDDDDAATLDFSSPLLRQPEHIGVTRAKIRTGWFTALTQNRKTTYLALVAVIGVLMTGLYLSRRAQRPHPTVSRFEQTVAEYRQTLRGPMTHLNMFASDSSAHLSKKDTNRIIVVGLDLGVVLISRKEKSKRILRYSPYDTLIIAYDTLAYIAVTPASSAFASRLGGDSLRPKYVVSDTAYYVLSDEKHLSYNDGEDSARIP